MQNGGHRKSKLTSPNPRFQIPPSPPVPNPNNPPLFHSSPHLLQLGLGFPMDPPPPAADGLADPMPPWDWAHFLDFPIDDVILDDGAGDRPLPPPPPPPPEPTSSEAAGRVRKRDPRLLCENFLAGRVPCACPELDALAEEEEDAGVGMAAKKRAKGGGGGAAVPARCQVTGCETDISQLKGYHRRHRVCLRCANAATVVLDGEAKRYCQQCGKFHVLADFDEGKRSCRRKLERHNKRRRRRTNDKSDPEKDMEHAGSMHLDVAHEPKLEATNGVSFESDSLCMDDKTMDTEVQIDSEDHGSPFFPGPSIHVGHIADVGPCAVASDTPIEERGHHQKSVLSPSYENMTTYSTLCPTGRISFKLYDWNPAEFPRRLRLQIFQWLANMPVELEGYIRPGCTILTAFIAMPCSMWNRLSDDTVQYLHRFFKEPQNLFSGRGLVHIYLNNTHYQVLRDGTSLVNIKMEVQVPKIHFAHPLYFEAGKPVEFVVCGTNLLQPKFRLLVSFAGKYLAGEICHTISHGNIRASNKVGEEASQHCEHQMLKINIPCSKADVFGPAFVEVENESGLSNFIPVLFADKDVCIELQSMQQLYDLEPVTSQLNDVCDSRLCEVRGLRQLKASELLLDIAWLLREPPTEENVAFFTSSNIQRLNHLLNYLIQSKSVNILRKVLDYIERHLSRSKFENELKIWRESCSLDVELLEACINNAKMILQRKSHLEDDLKLECLTQSMSQTDHKHLQFDSEHMLEDVEVRTSKKQCLTASVCKDESYPLLAKYFLTKDYSCRPQVNGPDHSWYFSRMVSTPRLVFLVMASVLVCSGLCAAYLHPHMLGRFMISAKRCVFRGTPNQ